MIFLIARIRDWIAVKLANCRLKRMRLRRRYVRKQP
jgi:hypothetical protein